MAKIPKLPKGRKTWALEDRSPIASQEVPATATSVAQARNVYELAGLNDGRAQLWLTMDSWTQEQAVMLLCGIDPLVLSKLLELAGGELEMDWPLHYDALNQLLSAASLGEVLRFPAAPRNVLKWADAKGLRLPAQLLPSIDADMRDPEPRSLPMPKEEANRAAILHWLSSEGLDPLALPRAAKGLPDPVKQRARAGLAAARPPVSPSAFDKAWKALRREGLIGDA